MKKRKHEPAVKNWRVDDKADVGPGAIVRDGGFVYDRVLQQKIRHRAELIEAFCTKYYDTCTYWTFGTREDEWDSGVAKAVHYFTKWLSDQGLDWILCLEQGSKSFHVHGHLIIKEFLPKEEAQRVWVRLLCYYAYKGKRFMVKCGDGKTRLFDGEKIPILRGRGNKIDDRVIPESKDDYFRKEPGSLGYVKYYTLKYKCKSQKHLANYLIKATGLAAYLGKSALKGEDRSAEIEGRTFTHRSSNYLRQSLAPVIEQIREERLKKTSQKYVYIRMRTRAFLASVYQKGWARNGLTDDEAETCDKAFEAELERLKLSDHDIGQYPAYNDRLAHDWVPYMASKKLEPWEEKPIPVPYMEKKNF